MAACCKARAMGERQAGDHKCLSLTCLQLSLVLQLVIQLMFSKSSPSVLLQTHACLLPVSAYLLSVWMTA